MISQPFGVNKTGIKNFYTRYGLPAHEGIDFDVKRGDPIYAADDGIVKAVNIPGQNGVVLNHAYGVHIKLVHEHDGQNYQTQYCHLSAVERGLAVGKTIRRGQLIGYAGDSGNVVKREGEPDSGVHLHFMVRREGNTAKGIKQKLGDGTLALYPNDIVDPALYLE